VDHSESIEIAVAPETAFAAIADLPAMGRRSPENRGGKWLNGVTGPARAAKFKGDNTHGSSSWSTIATVTDYAVPNRFAFNVKYGAFKISRWVYDVERTPGGCRVTESWTDRRGYLVRRDARKNDYDRAEFTRESIRETLARLKAELEAAPPT